MNLLALIGLAITAFRFDCLNCDLALMKMTEIGANCHLKSSTISNAVLVLNELSLTILFA